MRSADHGAERPEDTLLADAVAPWRFFDSLPEGIVVGLLGPEAKLTTVNAHLKQMLGCAVDTPDDRVDPFHPERFIDQQARAVLFSRLQNDGGVRNYPLRLRRNDGSLIWVEVTATRSGAVIRDVTERKHHEDQSRGLHHQLLQAEKMAALGQTISGVAHELNNPLATILSWAERLAETPADDKSRRGLEVILKEAERAARIVRNLLTFARKRQSTRMMVDVNDVVRDTLALRAYEQRVANIAVVQTLAAGIPEVFADAHQIKQVLLNLVINAEQAMVSSRGRGTLTVRTWHDADRESVVLEVNDDGPGIAEESQDRIFDPFFTTKEVGKGTGLGLSVAYAISQEHGGRIWVASQSDAGASFFVELPVGGHPLQARTPAPAAVSLETFKGLRVLVVEDEPALATAVSEALADAGFVVDRACDGEDGLTRLTQGTYDLIICDLKMPRIDGMQFYRAMAAATPALARRVIFVTGAVAGTDAERFLEETGCRWLAKPFRLGELLRAAREALA
ncbi:MAG: response regulator [Acidobacteria bacterium]|nr:response regulator [Acidobacteriota bacterium]